MAIAHNREVRSLELEAGLSLARLWKRWGKPSAAYAMLADIHGAFTEGFDTADWREAKIFLEGF